MPRSLEVPAFLDTQGQHLWLAFITTRERAIATRRAFRQLEPAMRRNTRPGILPDPAVTARYQAARRAADDAEIERRRAEREYHAYRRATLVRTTPRARPWIISASADD
jgi:hypothetical protein